MIILFAGDDLNPHVMVILKVIISILMLWFFYLQVMISILKDMGIVEFEPRVINQVKQHLPETQTQPCVYSVPSISLGWG